MTEFRVRAYSSVSDEGFVIDVPDDVVPRVEAIVASGITVYGPSYSRPCVETLRDLNRAWEHHAGYAEQRLVYCESKMPVTTCGTCGVAIAKVHAICPFCRQPQAA